MRLSLLLLVTLLAPHVQAKLGAPNSDSNSDTDTVSKSESESGVQHGTPTLRLVRQRELQNDLVYYGSNPVERFPLGVCEGDCDDDADCQVGLVCFQRDGNSDPIPGCSGSDNSRNDYCVLPSNAGQTPSLPTPTVPLSTPAAVPISDRFSNAGSSSNTISSSNVLSLVGNNGQPASRFPLGMCEGHCEGDHQCAPGLVCHSRVTGQTFPGCIAGINTNWYANYCLLPQNQNNLIATQPQPQPQPRPQSQPIFTPRPTSRPTPRPTSRPTSRPTPAPVPRPTPSGITREQSMELVLAGNNGFPASAFPLQRCQGDCDTDSECAPGLVCMSDRSVANIPGCVGVRQYADYCVSSSDTAPPTPQPTPAPTRPPVTPGIPTSSIAIPGLVISTLPPSPVPTLNPTPNPTAFPTPFPTPFPTNRRAPDPTPPPTNKPTFGIPTMAPTNPEPYYGVRLRLYWEEGYTWQESTREKFWCMMSDYRGQPGTGKCWNGEKTQPCNSNELYIADCNNDKRQLFDIMFVDDGEVMLRVSGDNRCFQRDGYKIVLAGCDPTDDLQRWISPRGAFFQRRFEIANPSMSNYCATQEHHPKPGEVVWLEPCILSRHPFHQTNYWMRW